MKMRVFLRKIFALIRMEHLNVSLLLVNLYYDKGEKLGYTSRECQ